LITKVEIEFTDEVNWHVKATCAGQSVETYSASYIPCANMHEMIDEMIQIAQRRGLR
jgi:hypothetical protein